MFDIGFWEIMLISIIGLVVLGPQRLPVAIRTVVKWINTAKRMANSVKSDISQELELHEMNEKMIKASKKDFDQIDSELKASIEEMKNSVEDLTRPYKNLDDAIETDSKNSASSKDRKQTSIKHSESNSPQPAQEKSLNE